CQHSFRSPYSF
nr:immunoglobulin light chain junction region [Macaca mulatta]MOV80786.1 immunoglobulin light chain junction region [Macaca mulatta]MOV83742.1 immunoglobulin light chain junction region [Macaca mulatta]MOV84763.1 immunoglobulin light chain junction region [Macaca mulatta]MOV85496.1 immunoglobulin light chain junction region [Macaca mulatta]